MAFQTRRFGPIDVPEEKVLRFRDGMPGLECMKMCHLIRLEETLPFYWLQSLVDGDVALPVINPLDVVDEYRPVVEESALAELKLASDEHLLVLLVAVLPVDPANMTANMAAPILINIERNLGRQVVLDDPELDMRQPIWDAVCRKLKEARECSY